MSIVTSIRGTKSFEHIKLDPKELEESPLELAETLPASWINDPALADVDLQELLRNSWQYVGHVSQLPNVGDFLLTDIAQRSVIVVRSGEGPEDIRCFHNVCKHRGGPLATKSGNNPRFKCMYHGWTYDLSGDLRGVPEFQDVQNFDRCKYGLSSISIEVWQGLIFINMTPNPDEIRQSVAEQFSGIAERIAPHDLTKMRFAKQTVDSIACNWKVYIENYLEGYHLPQVHPGLSKLLDYREYKTELYPWYSLQFSPFKPGENIYSGQAGSEGRDDEVQAFYYFVFPNMMFNILPGRLQMNRIDLIDADRCDVVFDYFYLEPDSEQGQAFLKEDMTFADEIQREDIEICEAVQRNLKTGVYDKGRFSVKRESGVHHFQNFIRREYKRALNR